MEAKKLKTVDDLMAWSEEHFELIAYALDNGSYRVIASLDVAEGGGLRAIESPLARRSRSIGPSCLVLRRSLSQRASRASARHGLPISADRVIKPS